MIIPQNIIEELVSLAEKDAPDEACGYLLGTGDTVTENYWMENIDHSPEHFSFAPKDQFAALRYARAKGLIILTLTSVTPFSHLGMGKRVLILSKYSMVRLSTKKHICSIFGS